MSDFNLIDAFRIFDTDARGSVTSAQIQEGLSTFLGAQADIESVRRFMRIFDKDFDDDLTYQEFCDAFLPIDTQLANDLAMKPP